MGMPAARVTDMHVCPLVNGVVPHVGGPILPPCEPTVLTGNFPQARVGDMCVCVGPPDTIALGSMGVLVGGEPAARIGDMTAHGGSIVMGWPTVLIGDTMSGSGNPGDMATAAIANGSSSATDPGTQAKAYINAYTEGAYFCRRCFEKAMADAAAAAGQPVTGDAANT